MSYSPVSYPEKRESLIGSIVRAVASINLETIETAYHDIRYKIDYHLIHARLKYYSNSKNPRVIHTKLNNQTLITLRTNPHDLYLVRPGEFLTMGSEETGYNNETLDGVLQYYYHPEGLDVESCPPTFCETSQTRGLAENDPRDVDNHPNRPVSHGDNRPFVRDAEKDTNVRLDLKKAGKSHIARVKGWDDPSVSSAESITPSGKIRMKRTMRTRTQALMVEETLSDAMVDLPLESLLPRYLQSSYSSPITCAADEVLEPQLQKKFGLTKSATSGPGSGSLLELDSGYGNYAQYLNLLQVLSPGESVSMFRQNSPRHSRSPGRGPYENRPEDKKVWKVVLSDISLSAARLSTGSEGTSREDYESLKGDLTHARMKDHPDFFAENMKQAKEKFYGQSAEEEPEREQT